MRSASALVATWSLPRTVAKKGWPSMPLTISLRFFSLALAKLPPAAEFSAAMPSLIILAAPASPAALASMSLASNA